MEIFLGLVAMVLVLIGVNVHVEAKSIMHEIYGAMFILTALLLIGLSGVIYQLRKLRDRGEPAKVQDDVRSDPVSKIALGRAVNHYR